MNFGGDYVFAPDKSSKEDYELVPETRYTHEVSGFASCATDYEDDGEVNMSYSS